MSNHEMDRSKVYSLEDCLTQIQSLEKVCTEKFSPLACQNIQNYYRNYCYKTFANIDTCSSDNTLGGSTLNLSNKSPPPSR
jgi:hypothetical protein